jgi:hypothetical protein
MNGDVLLNNSDNNSAELRIAEPSSSGSNYTAFKTQAQSADVTYTLPAATPTANNYVLTATTSGTMSWTNPATMVGGVTVKYKSSDQNSTSTSLADDNDLQFAIGASEIWQVEWYLFTSGSSAGLKVAVTTPASATMKIGIHTDNENSNDDFEELTSSGTATSTNFEIVDNGSSMRIFGIIKNSTTAGNVKLQFARYNSSGTATIQSLSYCRAVRLQ